MANNHYPVPSMDDFENEEDYLFALEAWSGAEDNAEREDINKF